MKLKLNLEDLTVDSFDTSRALEKTGTVFGEQCTCYTNCTCPQVPTCGPATCAASCFDTCGDYTCAGSCYGTCDYSCACDSNAPCPSAMYTHCGQVICY